MSKGLLFIGGGGHCKSVIDSVLGLHVYSDSGIVDLTDQHSPVLGVPYLGADDELPRLYKSGYQYAFISKGSIGNAAIRERLYRLAQNIGFEMISIIDPSAVISRYSVIEHGCFIGKCAVINAGAVIKTGAIINTGAVVEHDCTVDEFAHLASGTVLGGGVVIGKRAHIGSGAVVRQGLTIGADAMIGIGSVVTKSIPKGVTAYGNPCKIINDALA